MFEGIGKEKNREKIEEEIRVRELKWKRENENYNGMDGD